MRLRHPDGAPFGTHFQHLYVAGDQGMSLHLREDARPTSACHFR
ncbi:hypothetical protein [Kineosporia babensis]|nr:hypothetical protein [Kineosporia babensis]